MLAADCDCCACFLCGARGRGCEAPPFFYCRSRERSCPKARSSNKACWGDQKSKVLRPLVATLGPTKFSL